MKRCLATAAVAVAAFPAVAAARPVPDTVAAAIERRAAARSYLPTRMLIGFHYLSWTNRSDALVLRFRNKAGRELVWTVRRAAGPCTAGREKTFQLAGNKVYWAAGVDRQFAWRCVRGLRLEASSATPASKLADVGLGRVVASGKQL